MKYEIYSADIANMPWEERPEGCTAPIWRSKLNPIIKRDILPNGNSVFNSAAVPNNA